MSLSILFLGLSALIHADKGFITVDGKNIEMNVERQYQAPASYPRKALRLAKEGYVIVEFDVSADGDVIDPFVLEGEPAGLFDRAAMKCNLRGSDDYLAEWHKAEPYIIEGDPDTVASSEAERIESEYSQEKLKYLIENEGWK